MVETPPQTLGPRFEGALREIIRFDFVLCRTGDPTPRPALTMPRPQKPICKKCQALQKRAEFWRNLASRYKAALDQISPLTPRSVPFVYESLTPAFRDLTMIARSRGVGATPATTSLPRSLSEAPCVRSAVSTSKETMVPLSAFSRFGAGHTPILGSRRGTASAARAPADPRIDPAGVVVFRPADDGGPDRQSDRVPCRPNRNRIGAHGADGQVVRCEAGRWSIGRSAVPHTNGRAVRATNGKLVAALDA
jgi:hypothetical protein